MNRSFHNTLRVSVPLPSLRDSESNPAPLQISHTPKLPEAKATQRFHGTKVAVFLYNNFMRSVGRFFGNGSARVE